ncbi:MAG TPA: putative DNA binding domain-containing protein [Treponemataceae bacterium]|nr:putative DNA binding domain-containing protein [Treponemataceae bacterium]
MNITEGATLELKREYSEEIKKTVVAFANTAGGVIYLGVNDDGTVRGIEKVDDELLRVSNAVRNSIKPDVTMFVSYIVEDIEDKAVIKITVQKGSSRPYYLTEKGLRPAGVYVRQGASCMPASESAIFKMIKETGGDTYEELRSIQQKLTFSSLTREFASRNIPFGKHDRKRLKLVNPDGMYTNLALLLSDQCIHSVKAAVFEGVDEEVFKDRKEFTGSLIQQLNDVYEFIDRYNKTRSVFHGLHREDSRDYPQAALREALLNALVHRDYAISASILIHIFDDRLEIVSVGGLVHGLSRDDILLGVSSTRNENLSKVFYRLMLIEAYGAGLPRILNSYESLSCAPQISVSDNAFKIVLPNVNYEKAEKGAVPQRLKAAQNGDLSAEEKAFFERLKFSESSSFSLQQMKIYEFIKSNEICSRKDIENFMHISQSTAGKVLTELVNSGMVKLIGRGRSSRYMLS